MITAEIPTISFEVSFHSVRQGISKIQTVTYASRCFVPICSVIQVCPVDELFMPKKDVKKPSGVWSTHLSVAISWGHVSWCTLTKIMVMIVKDMIDFPCS